MANEKAEEKRGAPSFPPLRFLLFKKEIFPLSARLGLGSRCKSVQTHAVSNIHLIAGNDEGRIKDAAARAYRELTGGNDDGFTHEIIDAAADNAEGAYKICDRAIESLNTMPFFGNGKVVWLKSANFLGDDITGRAERTQQGIARLKDTLEAGLGDGVIFLLSATQIDKRRTFWNYLKKAAKLQLFDKIDTTRDGWEDEVAALVQSRAKSLDLTFDPEALELFIMQAGEATRQIDVELEKIDVYLGPDRRTITLADVRTMVPTSRAGVVFEIGKSLQHGDAARAIELINQQIDQGESAIGIIRASLIPTLRNLFFAKILSDSDLPTGSYKAFAAALDQLPEHRRAWLPQKKAGGVSAYPLFLSLGAARKFKLDKLRELLRATHHADKDLVTTGLDPRLILHRLIAQTAAARR